MYKAKLALYENMVFMYEAQWILYKAWLYMQNATLDWELWLYLFQD